MPGRNRKSAARRSAPFRRLDALEGSAPQGRLVRQAARRRALRLGVRIHQRVLSRRRRYRHGAARVQKPRARPSETKAKACVERRAVDWLLAMQGSDGGWAAFDVDNNWKILSNVPFADHNAMLDPSCPDITGRVLEALVRSGVKANHPAIRKGVRLPAARAGTRWKLVRPLGRQLYLRHVSGSARLCARPA